MAFRMQGIFSAAGRPAAAALALFLAIPGCARNHYRRHADREVYATIQEKTTGTPWRLPGEFSIDPDPRSRLYDPSDPDFPLLPDPGPFLRSYALPELMGTGAGARPEDAARPAAADTGERLGLPVQPIPEGYWDAIPRACLARMVEFQSVRDEYRREYESDPPAEIFDPSPRLTLDDIIDLAILNSREYQAQKESLYRSALALTLERFDYMPKFSSGSTGADASHTFSRSPGSGYNETSVISPQAQAEAMLITGGNLITRFANEVVLTFEGPEGFSKDIGSEMLFNFTQSVFQRDVRLNPLVQAERNLVYAARDFARFRKEFFFQIASQYYGLLRNYRNIEIESQNYFSLVRTFQQAQAEVRAGVENAPNPVAVDQFEQSMLSGRSSLITSCNRLEEGIDNLKLALGLPTEEPINLDLTELDQLTLRDEIEVAAERVRRWLNRVLVRRGQPRPDVGEILNADVYLIERILEWLRLRLRLERDLPDAAPLEGALRRFRVDQARVELSRIRTEVERLAAADARAPLILVYQRVSELVDALEQLAGRQLALVEALRRDAAETAAARGQLEAMRGRIEALRERLRETLQDPQQERLEALLGEARALRMDLEALSAALDRLLAAGDDPAPTAIELERILAETDRLVETARRLLEGAPQGLPPVDILEDEAMKTALIQRLDLMNERGRLADDRRSIKIAADDLKTVLDIGASHSIRTRDNKPFKFTSQDSTTRLSMSIDLPFNRRAQRNNYRQTLIEYQTGRRSLMALEDRIKFDIRDGLRTLSETRIQYPISVTQAALAAEQVTSVRLQLALGVQGVRGTDLLDALQSSRQALISVANARIGYIVDRAGFVLDLELMDLDDEGFWPRINDADYQPASNLVYPAGAGPAYGSIPRYLLVSPEFRRSLDRPPPGNRAEPPAAAAAAKDSAARENESDEAGEAQEPAALARPSDGAAAAATSASSRSASGRRS